MHDKELRFETHFIRTHVISAPCEERPKGRSPNWHSCEERLNWRSSHGAPMTIRRFVCSHERLNWRSLGVSFEIGNFSYSIGYLSGVRT